MAKRGRKAGVRKAPGRKRAGRRGPLARLASLDIAVLKAALDRKLSLLADEKAQLLARVADLDRLMADGMVTSPVGRPAKAAKRRGRRAGVKPAKRLGRPPKVAAAQAPTTLSGRLAELLGSEGKSMRVLELVEALRQSGYPSKSRHLRSMVNQALSRDERFRKVRRGLYRVR